MESSCRFWVELNVSQKQNSTARNCLGVGVSEEIELTVNGLVGLLPFPCRGQRE